MGLFAGRATAARTRRFFRNQRCCWNVIVVRVQRGDELGEDFVVNFSSVKFSAFAEFSGVVHVVDFVVAAPKDETRMISQSLYDSGGFGFYFL